MIRHALCGCFAAGMWLTSSSARAQSEFLRQPDLPLDAPAEQPPASLWDRMALRFEGSYAAGHLYDIPFHGGQFSTSIGLIQGPFTFYSGLGAFFGRTEAGLSTAAQHVHLALECRAWRFRFGTGFLLGSFQVSRVSRSGGELASVSYAGWAEASLDILRFDAGRVPIALLAGARAYASPQEVHWSPSLFVGVHL